MIRITISGPQGQYKSKLAADIAREIFGVSHFDERKDKLFYWPYGVGTRDVEVVIETKQVLDNERKS